MMNGWREIKKSWASAWHPVQTQMYILCQTSVFVPRKALGKRLWPFSTWKFWKRHESSVCFSLVCTVLCPRILEALRSGAVYFHSDPELSWSPGALCVVSKPLSQSVPWPVFPAFWLDIQKACPHGNTLQNIYICNYSVLKKCVMLSVYPIKSSQGIL